MDDVWLQDKISVLDGNCSFHVDYLGRVDVSEPTDSNKCRDSSAILYQKYITDTRQSNPAVLWVTGYELRVVDKESKKLILAQTIEKVLSCASVTDTHHDQLFYTCRDTSNDQWSCHLFVVKDCSSNRPCRAIGFAFRVCLRRKIIREGRPTNATRSVG